MRLLLTLAALIFSHVQRFHMTAFQRCVANREAGQPGAITYSTIQWHIDTGNGYYGAYQFALGTWKYVLQQMGEWDIWPSNPAAASPRQQVAAFAYWVVRDPGAWPVTVPACE